jgi:RNA polymerase sigma-70 factor (ECF subfamily)
LEWIGIVWVDGIEENDLEAAGEMPRNQDDYGLMRRIAGGEADALGELYDRYAGVVMATGLRVLKDRGAAEDFTLDVFWELWDRADRYDPGRGAPITYLLTLARSRAIDRKRSPSMRSGRAIDPTDPATGVQAAAMAENPLENAQRDERGRNVRQALQALEPAQRQVVELAFFEGLSHSEIAARLDKPLGTVKTNIRQGLIRLRELLRNE